MGGTLAIKSIHNDVIFVLFREAKSHVTQASLILAEWLRP